MSLRPLTLIRALRNQVAKRGVITNVSEIGSIAAGESFYAYDNDGGVLLISVVQYKDPIR